MNTFLPSRYDEFIARGAVALQLWDGARDARLAAALDVLVEREDPLRPQWTLDQAPGFPDEPDSDDQGRHRFPKRPMRRRPVNLHAVVYGEQISVLRPKLAFEVRIVDARWRYLPRRLRVPIPATPDADTAGQPMMRIRRTALFPGPAYDVISGSTGLRGRVTVAGVPVRWARIVVPAASGGAGARPRAVAHGDDKGEFLLILPPSSMRTLSASDATFSLPIRIGRPPSAPTPDEERAIKRDRISDMRLDVVGAATPEAGVLPARAALDSVAMGWAMPGVYVVTPEISVTFTAGDIHRQKFEL